MAPHHDLTGTCFLCGTAPVSIGASRLSYLGDNVVSVLVCLNCIEPVAARYHSSVRTIQERVSRRELPHRRFPNTRRILFDLAELDRFDAGDVELETIELRGGGRIVRPVQSGGMA